MKQLFCVSSWTYITFCIRIWNHWVSQIYRNRGNQKGLGFFVLSFCSTELVKPTCSSNQCVIRTACDAPLLHLKRNYTLCAESNGQSWKKSLNDQIKRKLSRDVMTRKQIHWCLDTMRFRQQKEVLPEYGSFQSITTFNSLNVTMFVRSIAPPRGYNKMRAAHSNATKL